MPGGSSFQNIALWNKGQGGELVADTYPRLIVRIGAVSAGASFSVVSDCSASVGTMSVTAAGTTTIIAAKGASTNTRVVGLSVCNESTANGARFELRFGTTPFWRGSLAAGVPYNWSLVNHPVKALNKAVVLYANGAVTATCTVFYERA
jgi:hypothetical protein